MKNNYTQTEIIMLKKSLLNLRNSTALLEKDLENEALEDLKENTSEHVIDADISTESSEREFDLKMAQLETSKINEIDSALQRMDSDDYGICEECGEQISFKRLVAVPYARFCLSCEVAFEKENKSHQKGQETDIDFGKPLIRQFR